MCLHHHSNRVMQSMILGEEEVLRLHLLPKTLTQNQGRIQTATEYTCICCLVREDGDIYMYLLQKAGIG